MNRFILSLVLSTVTLLSCAQMHVKKENLTTFTTSTKVNNELAARLTSASSKANIEYGILPYNAQCNNCVELIDKRTIDSRLFIDPVDSTHTYSQKSYFPLHYKTDEQGTWQTIDPRLKPMPNNTGLFIAKNQPIITKCDLNNRLTSLTSDGFEFEFNQNLSLYFFDENRVYTQKQTGSYNNYTIGDNGLEVKNIWPGITMQQLFNIGQIECNYIIDAPLQLPITSGFMVIEDHFTLPDGYTFTEKEGEGHNKEGYYLGDYELKNTKGELLFIYKKPIYLDVNVFGMHGTYNLINDGNNYTLQMLIPIDWLTNKQTTYPILIDPTVVGLKQYGNFTSSGNASANLAFTSMQLGTCDYHMNVEVPGRSILQNSLVDLEYRLTYNTACGAPPLSAPYCTFSQVKMEVLCDTCNTSSGVMGCNPSIPPYTGTCTTDPNLVPIAHPIYIDSVTPNYLACIPPQCADYNISFTLKNHDSICGDVCGYLCAEGTMWRMTVEPHAPIDTPSITLVGDTLFSSIAFGYQWYLNNTAINGATLPFYIVTQPGHYSVALEDSTTCGQYVSSVITINCLAHFSVIPDTIDSGIYTGVLNNVGTPTSFNWDFGDGTSSTDHYPNHTYSQPGTYTVCLTITGGGCISTYCDSALAITSGSTTGYHLNFGTISDINALSEATDGITITPNPTKGKLFIKTSSRSIDEISLYNTNGQLIQKQKYVPYINISTLPNGIYFIELSSGSQIIRKKIIKQ